MSNAPKTLSSVADVVTAFGGPSKLAAWAGHGSTMVSNWEARGYIPPGWYFRLAGWATANGFELSPRVFGQDEDPRPKCRAHQPAYA